MTHPISPVVPTSKPISSPPKALPETMDDDEVAEKLSLPVTRDEDEVSDPSILFLNLV